MTSQIPDLDNLIKKAEERVKVHQNWLTEAQAALTALKLAKKLDADDSSDSAD